MLDGDLDSGIMAKLDKKFIDALLYEEESVVLDFKKEQYRFKQSDDDDKSELLKDILAFANAWRRTDAFILIGIEELKGKRSRVVGINEFLDDAAIQQFVNRKTQRPITFSYQNLNFEGKDIAVIQIPCQERPFYLRRDYGRVKKDTVYIRRGSSTDEASLDEVSRMGTLTHTITQLPELEVFFARPSNRERIEGDPVIKGLLLRTPERTSVPDYDPQEESPNPWGISVPSFLGYARSDYYRELIEFTKTDRLVTPVHIAIANSGNVTAHDVRIELLFPHQSYHFILMDACDFPTPPQKRHKPFWAPNSYVPPVNIANEVWIEKIGENSIVKAESAKVQPKATHWFQDPFYIGSTISQAIKIEVIVYADNLCEPQKQQLSLIFDVKEQFVSLEDVLGLERERYRSSPEYKRFLQERGLSEDGA